MFLIQSWCFAHTAQYPIQNTYVQLPTAKYNIPTLPCVQYVATTHYDTVVVHNSVFHVTSPSYPSVRLWYSLLAVVGYVIWVYILMWYEYISFKYLIMCRCSAQAVSISNVESSCRLHAHSLRALSGQCLHFPRFSISLHSLCSIWSSSISWAPPTHYYGMG